MKKSGLTMTLPALCRPGIAVHPTVQLNMNFLNNDIWIETLATLVKQWVSMTEYQGSGTLWSMTQKTVDFGKPVLAEFILPHGLPGCGDFLLRKLNEMSENAALSCTTFFLGQEAWRAFCHVERGQVWLETEDLVTWRAL